MYEKSFYFTGNCVLCNKKLPSCNRTRVEFTFVIPPLTTYKVLSLLYALPLTEETRHLLLYSDSNSGVIFFHRYLYQASTIPDSLKLSTVKYSLHHSFSHRFIILSILRICQGLGGIFSVFIL